MFPGYYHNPPKRLSTRMRCPVCQEEVYSRAGIHPQCAVWQLESQKPETKAVVVAVPAVLAREASDGAPALVDLPVPAILSPADHAGG